MNAPDLIARVRAAHLTLAAHLRLLTTPDLLPALRDRAANYPGLLGTVRQRAAQTLVAPTPA